MRKAIITIGMLSLALLLLLFAAACSKEKGITLSNESAATNNTNNDASATGATGTVQTSISGDISNVDSLNSELNDSDLQNVDAELTDINW